MQLQAIIWLFLPVIVAGGSALVSYYIMQSRMEVALAKERESLAEAHALIQTAKVTMEERIRATEEATRRTALDEMMREIRVEERSYIRDTNTPEGTRRAMVMQERVYFRNMPLSTWTEREMLIEAGPMNSLSPRPENLQQTVLPMPVQAAVPMPVPVPVPAPVQINAPQHAAKQAPRRRDQPTLVAAHAAFGAQ